MTRWVAAVRCEACEAAHEITHRLSGARGSKLLEGSMIELDAEKLELRGYCLRHRAEPAVSLIMPSASYRSHTIY